MRRARLFYLRKLSGKKARLRSKVRDIAALMARPEEVGTADEAITKFNYDANGNRIIVRDDSGGNTIDVTLTVTNGTATLSGTTGLSVSGNGTASVTLSGTLSDINAALDGLQFDPTAAFEGFASVQIATTDFAGGGAGGWLGAAATGSAGIG